MKKKRETKKQRLERERETEATNEQLRQKREDAERQEREWREKQDREAASRREEETKREREAEHARLEKEATRKKLDDKIATLEVELTSLEKTYIETTHLFEIAQLDLMGVLTIDERKTNHAQAVQIATQLHHLRMALMARTAEHTHLEEQRGKKSSWESVLAGPLMWLAVGGIATWAYQLYAKSTEKKK